jgi:hypothetical protein
MADPVQKTTGPILGAALSFGVGTPNNALFGSHLSASWMFLQ